MFYSLTNHIRTATDTPCRQLLTHHTSLEQIYSDELKKGHDSSVSTVTLLQTQGFRFSWKVMLKWQSFGSCTAFKIIRLFAISIFRVTIWLGWMLEDHNLRTILHAGWPELDSRHAQWLLSSPSHPKQEDGCAKPPTQYGLMFSLLGKVATAWSWTLSSI